MSHKEAEEIAAEIAWMQDDPSFRPKIKNKKTNEKIIIKDYHKFYGITEAVILEVSTHHEEDDVVRLTQSKGVENG